MVTRRNLRAVIDGNLHIAGSTEVPSGERESVPQVPGAIRIRAVAALEHRDQHADIASSIRAALPVDDAGFLESVVRNSEQDQDATMPAVDRIDVVGVENTEDAIERRIAWVSAFPGAVPRCHGASRSQLPHDAAVGLASAARRPDETTAPGVQG